MSAPFDQSVDIKIDFNVRCPAFVVEFGKLVADAGVLVEAPETDEAFTNTRSVLGMARARMANFHFREGCPRFALHPGKVKTTRGALEATLAPSLQSSQ